MDQRVQPDCRDTDLGQVIQRGRDGVNVRLQHGGVGHHVERAGKGIFQPLHRLRESTPGAHHPVMDIRIMGLDGDLDMVQPGCDQSIDILRVRKTPGIGIQAGDLPVLLCMGDQFRQVFTQGGFATGEDDVGDAQVPGPVQDALPVSRDKFLQVATLNVVAVGAVIIAAVGQGQVQAVGGGRAC